MVAEVGEDALALTLVAAGLGVALVPASAAPSPAGGLRFLTVLDGGLRRTVVAAVRRTRIADPAVRLLLDALAGTGRRVAAAVPGVTAAVAPSAPPPPMPAGPRCPGPRATGAAGAPDRRGAGPTRCSTRCRREPRSNGRRDPWADRTRPEGLNGTNGTGTDLPPRNGTPAFGPDHPARNGSPDPTRPGPADLPGRNGTDPLGVLRTGDLPGTRDAARPPARRARPSYRPQRRSDLRHARPGDLPGPGPDRPGPAR